MAAVPTPTTDYTAIISVVAILLSPLIAVLVTRWMEFRSRRRIDKFHLFATLFGGRHRPISEEFVRALNLIDVVYADNDKVRELWHELFNMFGNNGLNNENGYKQRNAKSRELMQEMAMDLGYGQKISHLDMERVYIPVGMAEQEAKAEALHNAVATDLQGCGESVVPPSPLPSNSAPLNVEPKLPANETSGSREAVQPGMKKENQ